MRFLTKAWLIASSVLFGCGPAAHDSDSARAVHSAASSSLDGWTLPLKSGPSLGGPCESADVFDIPKIATCGNRGRVSLEAQNQPLNDAPPCGLVDIGRNTENETRACVDGDHLVVVTECLKCRVHGGSALHARMSELTDPQQRYLHAVLELGPTGPMNPDGWRALVSAKK